MSRLAGLARWAAIPCLTNRMGLKPNEFGAPFVRMRIAGFGLVRKLADNEIFALGAYVALLLLPVVLNVVGRIDQQVGAHGNHAPRPW
jgi:hypothetical protein